MDTMPFSPANILIVDDVNANLMVLTEIIRSAGFIARPVTSARQAVSAIEAFPPDLILLDISMPQIDGFVFCSMLKKNANTRDIPIIFISALNSTEDKIKGFKAGAVDYISKPFSTEEVTLRINIHLRMYKMQQEMEVYNKKLYKIINDQIRRIHEEQGNVIHALIKLTTKRDEASETHLEHVGRNSKILAMSLQLSPKYGELITNSFIDAIELSAQLLDIGITAISDSIVNKSEGLSIEEDRIMKSHTSMGAAILEEIYSLNSNNEFLKLSIDIARYHHENWDGSGYPSGIQETAIPLGARIVSVVNTYELLRNSTYRKPGCTHEDAMEIINKGAGSLFDPDVVNVFNKIQHQLKK